MIFGELVSCEGLSFFVEEVGKIAVSLGLGMIYKIPFYDLDTPSDALHNQIGSSVRLLFFVAIILQHQKTEVWESPVFSIGTFIGLKMKHG